MGKKVKKAVKKVVKKAVGGVGGLVKQPKAPKAPDMPDAVPQAVEVVAPPEETKSDVGDDTESGKRKTQSRGKNKLTVARASGRGLNI